MILFLLALATGLVCGAPNNAKSVLGGGEVYTEAIASAAAELRPTDSDRVKSILEASISKWLTKPIFATARHEAAAFCEACDQIRVEVGTQGSSTYEVGWLIWDGVEGRSLTSRRGSNTLSKSGFDRETWSKVLESWAAHRQDQHVCRSDLNSSDGDIHVVTYRVRGAEGAWVVYGLQLEGLASEAQDQARPELFYCKNLLRESLRASNLLDARFQK